MRVKNFEDALTVLNTEYSGTLAGDSPGWIPKEGCKLSMLVQYAVRAVKRPGESISYSQQRLRALWHRSQPQRAPTTLLASYLDLR